MDDSTFSLIDKIAQENGYVLVSKPSYDRMQENGAKLAKLKQEPKKESDYDRFVQLLSRVDGIISEELQNELEILVDTHKPYLSTQYKGAE